MNNLVPTLKYAWLTVKHKAFVFRAGLKTKAPLWRLIIHDLSKFGPSELPHYGRAFFGDKSDPDGMACAWAHHQNVNDHHWEWWIPRTGHNRNDGPSGDDQPLPMPMHVVREMVADWLGASRAYGGAWPKSRGTWSWLQSAYPGKMRLHPMTVERIEIVLSEIFPLPSRIRLAA